MKKNCFISAVFAVMLWAILPAVSFAQKENINPSDYFDVYTTEYAEKVVDFLASERLKGREAGTKQAAKAMKFIVKEFKKAGYEPILQQFSNEELAYAIGKPKEGKEPYPLQQCNVVAELKGKKKFF